MIWVYGYIAAVVLTWAWATRGRVPRSFGFAVFALMSGLVWPLTWFVGACLWLLMRTDATERYNAELRAKAREAEGMEAFEEACQSEEVPAP